MSGDPIEHPGEAGPPGAARPGLRLARRLRQLAVAAGALGLATLVAGSLLVWSAPWFWLGEVAASFAWYLGVAGMAGAVLLLLIRCRRMAIVTAALAGVQLWPALSLWLPDSRSGELDQPREALTVASSNLLWTNDEQGGLTDWMERTSPDVIVFLEVSPSWREILAGKSVEYPHQLYSPPGRWGEATWGTAILSRRDPSSARLIPLPEQTIRPPMEIVIELQGEPLVIRGAHPIRPGKAWRIERRDALLDALAALDWPGNALLLGDLNVTSTSPSFDRLLTRSGLRDSRRGFGRQPTYTTSAPIPGLRIAIDHVLVGDSIHVLERWTAKLPGSDHRTVMARVALRRE